MAGFRYFSLDCIGLDINSYTEDCQAQAVQCRQYQSECMDTTRVGNESINHHTYLTPVSTINAFHHKTCISYVKHKLCNCV